MKRVHLAGPLLPKSWALSFFLAAFLVISGCSDDDRNPVSSCNPEEALPVVTTSDVTPLPNNTAQCGGVVISEGEARVTVRGVCWNVCPVPTVMDSVTIDGSGAGSFATIIPALTEGVVYQVRAYATSAAGTGYGDIKSFSTAMGTVTDIDGNIYKTVKIFNKWWTAENLRVTHYRNGDPIPMVIDPVVWTDIIVGGFCTYDNDSLIGSVYGNLYNWYAVDDPRSIAPEGWHVADFSEYQALADSIGGYYYGGSYLKEIGIAHWNLPNVGASDQYGFRALPGGYRSENGAYKELRTRGKFWAAGEQDGESFGYILYHDRYSIGESYPTLKGLGYSVRLVRDSVVYPLSR